MADFVTVDRDRLVAGLNAYLRVHEGTDLAPNGLQVEGRREIRRIVAGVSACRALFERAAESGADAVLVHHGLFWEGLPRVLTGVTYERVAVLVRSGMSLLAYHLPLDRHPEVGNNAVAARALGLGDLAPFGTFGGLPVGVRGRFPAPVPAPELLARCRALYGQAPLLLGAGPAAVATLGLVSGAAQRALQEAVDLGLDAFLTGEASEWVTATAREAGLHYLAAGHHATERPGIQALGDHIARTYGVEVRFVDVPNPV
jgi:dinuclear metal center YbgI/SA1388 family protein